MIIGGGNVAYYLAGQLVNMGISVKIIEESKKRCEELSVLLPKAIIINGDGTDQEILNEEGLAETESFVSLTGIDEENILLTLHARKHSKSAFVNDGISPDITNGIQPNILSSTQLNAVAMHPSFRYIV